MTCFKKLILKKTILYAVIIFAFILIFDFNYVENLFFANCYKLIWFNETRFDTQTISENFTLDKSLAKSLELNAEKEFIEQLF
jgi:hypothetical protein